MADNYLERKMDELRRNGGAAPSYHSRLTPSGRNAGYLRFRFPSRRVLAADGMSPLGQAMVKAFVDGGCRVAFFAGDATSAQSREFAQQSGARCLGPNPETPDALTSTLGELYHLWSDLDIMLLNSDERLSGLLVENLSARRASQPVENPYSRIIRIASASEGGTPLAPRAGKDAQLAPAADDSARTLRHYTIKIEAADDPLPVARLALLLSLDDHPFTPGTTLTVS